MCKDESDTGLQPGGRTVHRWGGMMTKTKIKTKTKTKTETETKTTTTKTNKWPKGLFRYLLLDQTAK